MLLSVGMYHIVPFYCSDMLDSQLPGNLRISVARVLTTPGPGTLWNKNVCETFVRKSERAALTSLVLRVRMRSRSSTSCLKVGLWDEMACQQSFIIMYLTERKPQSVYSKRRVDQGRQNRVTQGTVVSFIKSV